MTAVSWLNGWYKRTDSNTARIGGNIANADIVGG